MNHTEKPPVGLMPRWLWDEQNPDPHVWDLAWRHREVLVAVARYREAGYDPPAEWLRELGVGE